MIRYKLATRWGAAVWLLLLALVIAGCGGGGGQDTAGGGSSQSATSAAAGSGGTQGSPATRDGDVIIEMNMFAFQPNEIRIPAGTTVTFVNRDQIAHDVVQTTVAGVSSGDYGFESPQIGTNQSWSYTFNESGTYPILCTVGAHYMMGMTATIHVD